MPRSARTRVGLGRLRAGRSRHRGTAQRGVLSVAYPFNALGYIVILTASVVLLHERANLLTWVGSLMVVSGLLIVVLTKP